MARRDPHSFADDAQAQVTHLTWTATVDFATHTLEATARLRFAAPGSDNNVVSRHARRSCPNARS